MSDESNERSGVSRRDLLRRGAIAGGAIVWAVPVVESFGETRAYAAGSQLFSCCYCFHKADKHGCDKSGVCNTGSGSPQSATACDQFCQSLKFKAGHYRFGAPSPVQYACSPALTPWMACGCFQK